MTACEGPRSCRAIPDERQDAAPQTFLLQQRVPLQLADWICARPCATTFIVGGTITCILDALQYWQGSFAALLITLVTANLGLLISNATFSPLWLLGTSGLAQAREMNRASRLHLSLPSSCSASRSLPPPPSKPRSRSSSCGKSSSKSGLQLLSQQRSNPSGALGQEQVRCGDVRGPCHAAPRRNLYLALHVAVIWGGPGLVPRLGPTAANVAQDALDLRLRRACGDGSKEIKLVIERRRLAHGSAARSEARGSEGSRSNPGLSRGARGLPGF